MPNFSALPAPGPWHAAVAQVLVRSRSSAVGRRPSATGARRPDRVATDRKGLRAPEPPDRVGRARGRGPGRGGGAAYEPIGPRTDRPTNPRTGWQPIGAQLVSSCWKKRLKRRRSCDPRIGCDSVPLRTDRLRPGFALPLRLACDRCDRCDPVLGRPVVGRSSCASVWSGRARGGMGGRESRVTAEPSYTFRRRPARAKDKMSLQRLPHTVATGLPFEKKISATL